MVSRVLQENKVPGTSMGTRAAPAPGPVPAGAVVGFLGESQVNSFLPCQTRRFEQCQDGPGYLKSLCGAGGIRMYWQTYMGTVHPLRL